MAGKKQALGRGLNSIIPDKISEQEELNKSKELEILADINKITPNKEQPRKNFQEDALIELSESIKQFGIIQPIVVHKKNNYFEIIAGERRWRAAKIAGLKTVPIIVKEYTEQEILQISLIENIQRENLNPIEEAIAYQKLIKEFNLKQDELAERVSKSRSVITNSIRLLKLDKRVQDMLIDEKITSGHARALITIEDKEKQYFIANEIFEKGLSVREIQSLIKSMNNPKIEKSKVDEKKDIYAYKTVEEKIQDILGSKVKINKKNNNSGKIEIDYYSIDELERVIELLERIK